MAMATPVDWIRGLRCAAVPASGLTSVPRSKVKVVEAVRTTHLHITNLQKPMFFLEYEGVPVKVCTF